MLIGSGMFNNRVFDFPYSAGRYEYDADDILSVMPRLKNADFIRESIAKVYTCDPGLTRWLLLNENSKIIAIIDPADGLAPEQQQDREVHQPARVCQSRCSQVHRVRGPERSNTLSCSIPAPRSQPGARRSDPHYYKRFRPFSAGSSSSLRERSSAFPAWLKDPRLYKNYFARDINAKLYGYGSTCPCCGYESKMINSFMLKNFSIGLLNDEGKEQKFRFSLYLCANDSYAAGGWIIDDVSIGGMSPFLWLEELSQIDYIPPEFLICRIVPSAGNDICVRLRKTARRRCRQRRGSLRRRS
ncbi:MAG: hypothetical protein ACLSG5_06345 [Oscillospiraceae bacterium]